MGDANVLGKRFLDRIHSALWREFRQRRGSIQRLQRRLGVCDNYLRTARSRGTLTLGVLGEALETLDVDPGHFFATTFPGSLRDALGLLERDAQTLATAHEPHGLAARTRQLLALPADQRSCGRSEQARLDELDALRDDGARGAREAAQAARAIVLDRKSPPEVACRALGVWASSLRVALRFERATVLIWRGLQIADQHECQWAAANLLQRASYLTAIRTGDYARGLPLADLAVVLFTEEGATEDIGLALLARGYMLRHLGQTRQAIRCYERALISHLPEEQERMRFGAHQSLTLAYRQLGDLKQAAHHAARALALAPPQKDLLAKCQWAVARIALDRRHFHEATSLYAGVLEALGDEPGELALASTEYVTALLHAGDHQLAYNVARSMTRLVIPLETDNPLVAAAVAELVRLAIAGDARLTLDQATQIQQAIERGGRPQASARRWED